MRLRLVGVFAAVTSMIAIAFLVPLALFVRDVARERALDDAETDASALFPVLAATSDVDALEVAVSRTPTGSAGRLSIFLPGGVTVGAALAPDARVKVALAEARAWTGPVPGGEEVVSPVVRADGSVAVVLAFVPQAELVEGVVRAWATLAAVGVALVTGSVVLADRLARSITAPVVALADASHRLGTGDLTARVEPAGPTEVRDVGAAFNTLAERVDQLLHAEREDVADLAHRLRTPLAALRLQVEQVDDAAVRAQLGDSADALGRSLDEVILTARRRSRGEDEARCDATAVVRARAEFWAVLAEEQQRAVGVELPSHSVVVPMIEGDLAAALDVLLENVFSHTPDGTPYGVELRVVERWAVLTVLDAGPGMGAADVAARGVSARSTGLGLDIARRTAEGCGGAFEAGDAPSGGALVRLRLPVIQPV